jgi:hypothetical protein
MRHAEMLVTPDLLGCAWCGAPAERHPVQGYGHMNDTKNGLVTSKDFAEPSADLVERRRAYRTANGRELAGIDSDTGEPNTDLVRATCRCGATTIVTPSRADIARCGACISADATGEPQ